MSDSDSRGSSWFLAAAVLAVVVSVCAVACAGAWVVDREAIWVPTPDGRLVPTFPSRGPIDDPPGPPQGQPIDWSKVDVEKIRQKMSGAAPASEPDAGEAVP